MKQEWIQTISGKRVYPFRPEPEMIDIRDIAHALSMICRYNGHIKYFYSVAQHSYMVSKIVPQEDALWGLLHDASEAYLGDVTRPIKHLMPDYQVAETRMMDCIATHFGINPLQPESIRRADLIMLATERRDLVPAPMAIEATEGVECLSETIIPWTIGRSRSYFLDRFNELYCRELF